MLPVLNGLVIPVQSTARRFLATPAETLHEIPDTLRAIAHPKQFPDHMRDAIQSPIIFGISVVKRAAFQGAEQTPTLRGVETTGTSGTASAGFGPGRILGFLAPPSHTAFGRADPSSDLFGTLAMPQQVPRSLTTARQLLTGSERSHAPHYSALATSPDINY